MNIKYIALIAGVFFFVPSAVDAQTDNGGFNQIDAQGNISRRSSR